MAGFLKPLSVTPLSNGRYWKTNRTLEYCVGSADSCEKVIIPEGFETDFASVPRLLWPVLPPIGKYIAAAVVHDYLYRRPQRFTYVSEIETQLGLYSRGQCDSVFKEAMGVLDVGSGIKQAMWSGVRVGGWWTWRRYRKQEQK